MLQDTLDGLDYSYTSLPISDFSKSRGTVTYQADVKFDLTPTLENPVVLSIDFLSEEVTVYLNGVQLRPYTPHTSKLGMMETYTFFNLTAQYDPKLEYQEITICTNKDPQATELYHRDISISTYANGLYQERSTRMLECLFGGIAYCLMMTGFIYMIMRPQRSVLTLVNLFDIVLIVFVVYAHTTISPYLGRIVSVLSLDDVTIRSFALFFLCMAIALGNDLTDSVFQSEKRIHPLCNHPLNACFFTLATIFACNPFASSGILYYVLIFCSLLVVGCILWRVRTRHLQQKLSPYLWFQFIKTIFIVVVLAIDIKNLHSDKEVEGFLLAHYCLFFIVHLFVRAYEYALPEKKIVEINHNLEATVAERTEKLTKANQVLQEISIRDALTNAYNRMYFEEVLLKALAEYHHHQGEEPLKIYLCIFDLDNFKQINDHFGHATGDEQLKETVELAQRLMPEEVLVSRIGGEEFTLLIKEKEEVEVLQLIECLRCGLEERAQAMEGRTTGSFGVTKVTVFSDRKSFFVQADTCLYYSKQHGKNCVTHDFGGEAVLADKST